MKRPRPWSYGRSALIYGGYARNMILAFKHGDRPEIARPAARWMVQAVREILVPDMLVAPVPLHWSRLLKRRYNQSALLARALSEEIQHEFCPDLLKRTRRTPMLDHLGTEARFETLASVIRVHRPRVGKLNNRPVLLVDDVMTSGATLTACAKACLDAGAREVRVVAMARSCKD